MSTCVLICTKERTWYLVHENAILSIGAHPWNNTISPGYQLIVLSVDIEGLPSSTALSYLTSCSLDLVPDPSTWQLTSIWHHSTQFRFLPPVGFFLIAAAQPILIPKWNKHSRPQITFWFSMPEIIILSHCMICCLLEISCFWSAWRMHWHSCGCRREQEVKTEMS